MFYDVIMVCAAGGLTLAIVAVLWLLNVNMTIARKLDRAEHDRTLLQMAVDDARRIFDRYADLHFAKNTPEGDKKAVNNSEHATALRKVLEATGFKGLPPIQRAVLDLRDEVSKTKDVSGLGFVDSANVPLGEMRRSIHRSHRGEGRNFVD